MQIVWDMWIKGYNLRETLLQVNAWAEMQGQPAFSPKTIARDRERIMQLIEDEEADKRTEHLETLRFVKQKAWEEFESTVAPMAKPGLLRVIQDSEELAAKIDGSMAPRKVEQHHTFSDDMQARVLVQVLVRHLGNEEAAARVLEEVQQTLELEAGSVRVIDAPTSAAV